MRIAITGTPGVGKSSAAKQVASILKLQYIDITTMVEPSEAVLNRNEDTLLVDVDTLKEALKDKDNLVIDSHFAEVFEVDLVFVLRCEPKTLYCRLKERGYSNKKVKENVLAEILDYCLISAIEHHDPKKIFEITENAVKEIVHIVENPRKEKSLASGSKTCFLTEENLSLVE